MSILNHFLIRKHSSPINQLISLANKIKVPNRSLTSSSQNNLQIAKLSSRALTRVSGVDTLPFLQGLMTNDVNLLKPQLPLYSFFLNQGGRVLFDTLIYDGGDEGGVLIESDSIIQPTLIRHLQLYKVKRKVEITNAQLSVWAIWNLKKYDPDAIRTPLTFSPPETSIRFFEDPRLSLLLTRLLTPPSLQLTPPPPHLNLFFNTEEAYRTQLYSQGIGEGVVDFPIGSSFPLEANGDYLGGISFSKGCYIGQELTARTFHTGVVRKRLMPFRIMSEKSSENADNYAEKGGDLCEIRKEASEKNSGYIGSSLHLKNNEELGRSNINENYSHATTTSTTTTNLNHSNKSDNLENIQGNFRKSAHLNYSLTQGFLTSKIKLLSRCLNIYSLNRLPYNLLNE